jgi:hypothetical protein
MKEKLENIADTALKWFGVIVGSVLIVWGITGHPFTLDPIGTAMLGVIMILSATKFPR